MPTKVQHRKQPDASSFDPVYEAPQPDIDYSSSAAAGYSESWGVCTLEHAKMPAEPARKPSGLVIDGFPSAAAVQRGCSSASTMQNHDGA